MDESIDSQILSQEQWAIELLARETHATLGVALHVKPDKMSLLERETFTA
jgi:hypothetical protein